MSTKAPAADGAALLVDENGAIEKVLVDGIGITEGLPPGAFFVSICDPASADKAARFLAEICEKGLAHEWELTARVDDMPTLVRFSGTVSDGALLIVAVRNRLESWGSFYDVIRQMTGITSEHANRLRVALKELALRQPANLLMDASMYDDMSRLNNELVSAQRELARKNAALDRMSAQKDLLLGVVAHDLRNPLGIISLCTQSLLQGRGSLMTDKERSLLSRLQSSCDFMAGLVEQLLDLSAIEAGKLALEREPFDLREEIQEDVKINRLLAQKKDIAIEEESDADAVQFVGDRGKIRQVMNNLIGNAIKYSPRGGRIRVHLHGEERQVRVAVSNEGAGIQPAELKNLFTPFGRTSTQATEGERSIGLGLEIVRGIVEAHRGRVSVDSKMGEGATFSFTLPLAS